MRKPTIQFNKTDFNTVDGFLKNNFSERKSILKVYLERQKKPFNWSGRYIMGPDHEKPWIMVEKENHMKIGEIMYQPGPEKDSIVFETEPEFNPIVHKLIDEIVNEMEFYGFGVINKVTHFNNSSDLAQYGEKKGGRPSLPPEEWAARIVKVKEGLELQENDPSLRLKQLPGLVGYDWGDGYISIYKSFIRARDKLRKLEKKYPEGDDPDGILDIVKEIEMKNDT